MAPRRRSKPNGRARGGRDNIEQDTVMPPLQSRIQGHQQRRNSGDSTSSNESNKTTPNMVDVDSNQNSPSSDDALTEASSMHDETMKTAIVELNGVSEQNHELLKKSEVTCVLKNRLKDLWKVFKFPNANPLTKKRTEQFIRQATRLGDQDFQQMLPYLQTILNTFFRSKRGTVTERMRDVCLGEPCLVCPVAPL